MASVSGATANGPRLAHAANVVAVAVGLGGVLEALAKGPAGEAGLVPLQIALGVTGLSVQVVGVIVAATWLLGRELRLVSRVGALVAYRPTETTLSATAIVFATLTALLVFAFRGSEASAYQVGCPSGALDYDVAFEFHPKHPVPSQDLSVIVRVLPTGPNATGFSSAPVVHLDLSDHFVEETVSGGLEEPMTIHPRIIGLAEITAWISEGYQVDACGTSWLRIEEIGG